MVIQIKSIAVAFAIILGVPVVGRSATDTTVAPTTSIGTAPAPVQTQDVEVLRPVKLLHPMPLPEYWDDLAQCETAGNWQDGGKWGGGLGIYTGTWKTYGGYEFAKHPGKATKAEQIIVARRIAIEGYQTKDKFITLEDAQKNRPWFQEPVGFSGWGCVKSKSTGKWRLGKPALVYHVPSTVVTHKFRWGQKGTLVGSLQAIIGAKQDMTYGAKTWVLHIRYLLAQNLSLDLAPTPKLPKPKRVSRDLTKRCPQYEQLAKDAGFPKNEITTVSYVMWKESRCAPNAHNPDDPGAGSYGLMQINSVWFDRLVNAGIIKKKDDLFDPATNLTAAFFVWTESVRSNNYGWDDWNLW